MKRILSVIAAPDWGGLHTVVERTTPYYADALYNRVVALPLHNLAIAPRLKMSGCELVHCDFVRPRKRWQPIHHIRYLRRFWSNVKTVKNIIIEQKIDCIEVVGLLNLQPLIAGLITKTPIVYQLHSTLAPRLVRRLLMTLFGDRVSAIMTSGAGMIPRHGGLEDLATPIIPFGAPIDVSRFQPNVAAKTALRTKWEIKPGTIVVGTLGNRGWQKRHEWIVEIANRLRDEDFIFIIAGTAMHDADAGYTSRVLDRIKELELWGKVKVLDQTDPAEILMNGFDVFILPSVAEGASLVTAEAMATGLPVVASNVGSIGDIVDADNGMLCDVNELGEFVQALLALKMPGLRIALGDSARRKAVERLSSQKCAEAHFKAYAIALS